MITKRPSAALVAGLILILPLAVSSAASAHPAADYYTGAGGKWSSNRTITFYVRNGFPSPATWNPTINRGADQWNAKDTGPEPRFTNAGATSTTGNADTPCSATYNGIYWRDLDYLGTGVLGYTPHCENSSGVVTRFSMSLDADAPWYVGTGATPNGRIDAWSVVTHEMGHATGWAGHFAESNDAGPTAPAATPCAPASTTAPTASAPSAPTTPTPSRPPTSGWRNDPTVTAAPRGGDRQSAGRSRILRVPISRAPRCAGRCSPGSGSPG